MRTHAGITSKPSTSAGLEPLKRRLPCTAHTCLFCTAGRVPHSGFSASARPSVSVRSSVNPHGMSTSTSGCASLNRAKSIATEYPFGFAANESTPPANSTISGSQ